VVVCLFSPGRFQSTTGHRHGPGVSPSAVCALTGSCAERCAASPSVGGLVAGRMTLCTPISREFGPGWVVGSATEAAAQWRNGLFRFAERHSRSCLVTVQVQASPLDGDGSRSKTSLRRGSLRRIGAPLPHCGCGGARGMCSPLGALALRFGSAALCDPSMTRYGAKCEWVRRPRHQRGCDSRTISNAARPRSTASLSFTRTRPGSADQPWPRCVRPVLRFT